MKPIHYSPKINPVRKGTIVTCLLCLFTLAGFAQQKVTLSGYIKDGLNGEALIGATVFVRELNLAAETNHFGFYAISVDPGVYHIVFSYVGFETDERLFQMLQSTSYTAELRQKAEMQEVVVRATDEQGAQVGNTEMGTVSLSIGRIRKLPVLFGEVDVLKALQLMPGVQSAGEGNSGFYVRGGGPDQNLILLDDAVVYNPGHLFGFFSVFNSDAVKNISLIKGNMPAQYGGRLSSVVDVSMKEGNMKEHHLEGGVGLIASRVMLEGPFDKDKGSFMVSARRTYIDLLIKPFIKGTTLSGSGYYFYDANLKANYVLGQRDRLYLSGYFGRDKFTFRNEGDLFRADIPWGNTTATLRWNHLFSNRVFMNVAAIYNAYSFSFLGGQNDFEVKLSSGIKDGGGKVDIDYYTTSNHHIRLGANYTYHKFIPNQVSGRSGQTNFRPDNALIKYAHESGLYIQDDFELGRRFRVNAGLRYSWFGQSGPYWRFGYDLNNEKVDSSFYGGSQIVKAYGGLEPRLNIRYQLSDHSSLKASASRSFQYIHLVTNNGTTLPTDLWVPSTFVVQPQESWQYAFGYFRDFLQRQVVASVELYYKSMANQIEYRPGYTPTDVTRDQELDFVFGKGRAYGAEFFINKTKGKLTGWIGYTLSWTYRRFPALNNNDWYPAKYDRRHDLTAVATYEWNKRWTFSSVFVFGSGNAITLPTNYYFIEQQVTPEYSRINEYRLFPYHRLDLSATYEPKPKKPKKWTNSWVFSIYNVYSRQNPYFLYVDSRGTVNNGIQAKVKQVSIFPILPAVTYNFRF